MKYKVLTITARCITFSQLIIESIRFIRNRHNQIIVSQTPAPPPQYIWFVCVFVGVCVFEGVVPKPCSHCLGYILSLLLDFLVLIFRLLSFVSINYLLQMKTACHCCITFATKSGERAGMLITWTFLTFSQLVVTWSRVVNWYNIGNKYWKFVIDNFDNLFEKTSPQNKKLPPRNWRFDKITSSFGQSWK